MEYRNRNYRRWAEYEARAGFEVERVIEMKVGNDPEIWKIMSSSSLIKYCELVRDEGRFIMDINLIYSAYCLCKLHYKLETLDFEAFFNFLKDKTFKEITFPDPTSFIKLSID